MKKNLFIVLIFACMPVVFAQKQYTLLKAEFPMSVSNPNAKYDLGIGYIERGNNTETAYEVIAQQWADLTSADGKYGIAIMNDCKYGWDKPADNTLRLTLLQKRLTGTSIKASWIGDTTLSVMQLWHTTDQPLMPGLRGKPML